LWKVVDEKVIDGTVNGVAALTKGCGKGMRRLQTGYVQNYALAMLIGLALIITYLVC